MSDFKSQRYIESYKFHHINTRKCRQCKDFSCEKACFKGIYKVVNKDTIPRSTVLEDREDSCLKCHMCTTACKLKAITID